MAPSLLQQRRTHNTLLIQKLLNLRDGASPFTLILDTLEQSGGPVVREFARRAKISKSKIIFISFATLRKKVNLDIDIFISTRGKSLAGLRTEFLSHLPPLSNPASSPQKIILILDTLNPLSSTHANDLPTFLSSLLLGPHISLLATYHTDTPLAPPSPQTQNNQSNPYAPTPLTTLLYLSTSILHISSLSHTIARKRARDRSLQEPVFGLEERREGIIVGLNSNSNSNSNTHGKRGEEGVVVEMEVRRKSGRGIVETFVLIPPGNANDRIENGKMKMPGTAPGTGKGLSAILLLDEHPLYATPPLISSDHGSGTPAVDTGEEVETTFNLSLTEKQKRDRESVVLPYFDAQKEGGALGAGEGGRILYEMGVEDREDFDDEEDEI